MFTLSSSDKLINRSVGTKKMPTPIKTNNAITSVILSAKIVPNKYDLSIFFTILK